MKERQPATSTPPPLRSDPAVDCNNLIQCRVYRSPCSCESRINRVFKALKAGASIFDSRPPPMSYETLIGGFDDYRLRPDVDGRAGRRIGGAGAGPQDG